MTKTQIAAIETIHHEFEGRCVACVEWCECETRDICTHGNVQWPCKTIQALKATVAVMETAQMERAIAMLEELREKTEAEEWVIKPMQRSVISGIRMCIQRLKSRNVVPTPAPHSTCIETTGGTDLMWGKRSYMCGPECEKIDPEGNAADIGA